MAWVVIAFDRLNASSLHTVGEGKRNSAERAVETGCGTVSFWFGLCTATQLSCQFLYCITGTRPSTFLTKIFYLIEAISKQKLVVVHSAENAFLFFSNFFKRCSFGTAFLCVTHVHSRNSKGPCARPSKPFKDAFCW